MSAISENKPTARQALCRMLWEDNPVCSQVLGICSALAVTNLVKNTLVMGIGLIFTAAMSNLTVSVLRNSTPRRVRMMVQILIIASYVIMVKIVLDAFLPEISRQLGPYVGLIITNCIIMGRCEAFACANQPFTSFCDGLGAGLGYSFVLLFIAIIREPLGLGTFFGYRVLPASWINWNIMVVAPGGFFMLALVIWFFRSLNKPADTVLVKKDK